MEPLLSLLLVSLATWQAVEVLHHSTGYRLPEIRDWGETHEWAILSCAWCQSVWVGTTLWLLLTYADAAGLVLVGGLAASRLANLYNDLTHGFCRTPRASRLADDTGERQPENPLVFHSFSDDDIREARRQMAEECRQQEAAQVTEHCGICSRPVDHCDCQQTGRR